MSLPLEQEMAIHLSYLEHRAAVAEGFAKLRARLTPDEPRRPSQADLLRDVWGDVQRRYLQDAARLQGQMIPTGHLANPFQAAAMANPMHGLHRPLGGAWPWD